MIDEAKKGDMFYRLVLSPDPKEEDRPKDLDMRELTERTIRTLEERAGEPVLWVGVLHADHAPHRHVHVLALVPGKLNVADLQALTGAATEAAQFQRQNLDLAQGIGIQAAIRRQAGDRPISSSSPTRNPINLSDRQMKVLHTEEAPPQQNRCVRTA